MSINKKRLKTFFILSLGAIIGAILLTPAYTTAIANLTKRNDLLYACMAKNSGQLRAVTLPDNCQKSETALAWNKASSGNFIDSLSGAMFERTDFSYRDFTGTDFSDSTFLETSFNGSLFIDANFTNSQIINRVSTSAFKKANFSGARFTNATFDSQSFDFSGTAFNNADFLHSYWLADINNASFAYIDFTGASFTGSVNESDFRGIKFNMMNQVPSVITNTNLDEADFSNVVLTEIQLPGSSLINTSFSGARFINANLWGTNFSRAILTGATWQNTWCPDGTNSDDNGNTCIGHLVPQNP